MGNVLNLKGKLDEALEAYTKALSIKPDYAEVYINMGETLKSEARLKEAISAFNKALSIKPDFAEAYWNRAGLSETLVKLKTGSMIVLSTTQITIKQNLY